MLQSDCGEIKAPIYIRDNSKYYFKCKDGIDISVELSDIRINIVRHYILAHIQLVEDGIVASLTFMVVMKCMSWRSRN